MTINQVIKAVDGIKPHSFSNDVLTMWLNEIEGMAQTDVMLIGIEELTTYTYDINKDTVLLVHPPHDKVYVYYLCAMIDFANNDYDKYENTMTLFNKFWGDYVRWYALTYDPANGKAVERGYYLSAYSIAVAHGYQGTEDEWLNSLKGEKGEQGKGWKVDGLVESADDLQIIPNPEPGMVYAVGAQSPYEYYIYDYYGGWINHGYLSSPEFAAAASNSATEASNSAAASSESAAASSDSATEASESAAASSKSAAASSKSAAAASNSATEASKSAAAASKSATAAENGAGAAEDFSMLSESFARGGTNLRSEENEDNAKYYCQEARNHANDAKEAKEAVELSLLCNALKGNAEGMNGVRLDNVSPLKHNISVTLEAVNIINQDEFFSSENNEYQLKGELGKTYILNWSKHPGWENENYSYIRIMKNNMFNGNIDIESDPIEITIEEGCTYYWCIDTTNLKDYFESVSMLADISGVGIKSYGKNLDPYNPDKPKENWDLPSEGNYAWYTLNVPCDVTLSLYRDKVVGFFYLYEYDEGETRLNSTLLFNDTSKEKIVANIKATKGHTYKLRTSKDTVNKFLTDKTHEKYFRFWLQVEVGSSSEYEEYKEPVDGVVAIYPTTTLVADTSGVNINATYNRDINSVIANIENAIANL